MICLQRKMCATDLKMISVKIRLQRKMCAINLNNDICEEWEDELNVAADDR